MPKLVIRRQPKVHTRSADSAVRSAGGSMFNLPLVAVVVVLLVLGLVTLYSVTQVNQDYSFSRQLFGVGLGVVAMVLLWLFDYRRFAEWFVPLLVLDIVVVLLPMVPGLGVEVNGATSWIALGPLRFQPSELAKPLTILVVAGCVSRYGGEVISGKDYLKMVGVVLIPFVLLFREDLGTALIILIIGFVVLFVGGASRKWLVITLLAFILGVAGVLALNGFVSDYTNGQVKLIKDYQMSRLLVFVDQDNPDYADDAYNLNQAKIAVGSGEMTGKGLGNATQSTHGFLPESATDFIFCVYAEQFGFAGAFVLIGLYLALMATALSIGFRSSDLFGSLVVAGIMGMWLFQILENIGMDLGLMPITGIPLPFMSYGSSFMIVNFICLGLLFSIWARRGQAPAQNRKAVRFNA